MENEKPKNQPVKKISAGGIKATIWQNTNDKNEVYNTIQLERIYKDKNDKWASTNSFRISDLSRVQMVARKAEEYLVLKDDSDKDQEVTEESIN